MPTYRVTFTGRWGSTWILDVEAPDPDTARQTAEARIVASHGEEIRQGWTWGGTQCVRQSI